jgi:hypothetical protein
MSDKRRSCASFSTVPRSQTCRNLLDFLCFTREFLKMQDKRTKVILSSSHKGIIDPLKGGGGL